MNTEAGEEHTEDRSHRWTRASCSFDLNADDLDVSLHVHVFENIIAKAVWEAHHGAFWELDVEGVVVEGDGQLLEERHSETETECPVFEMWVLGS